MLAVCSAELVGPLDAARLERELQTKSAIATAFDPKPTLELSI
jgi:hypothetical protein